MVALGDPDASLLIDSHGDDRRSARDAGFGTEDGGFGTADPADGAVAIDDPKRAVVIFGDGEQALVADRTGEDARRGAAAEQRDASIIEGSPEGSALARLQRVDERLAVAIERDQIE